MRNNETGGIGDQSPKKRSQGREKQIPSRRDDGRSEFFEKTAPESGINYAQVARVFLAKDARRRKFYGEDCKPSEEEVIEHATGLKEIDQKLKESTGELVVILYEDASEKYVYGIGRTNGKGLHLSTDPESNEEQLTFGTDAIMQKSVIEEGRYRSTMTPRDSIVIPMGTSFEVINQRETIPSFSIGDDEVKEKLTSAGVAGIAWYAFLSEQLGIDTETFFEKYVTTPQELSDKKQRQRNNQIRKDITNHRKCYDPNAAEVPLLEEETIEIQTQPVLVSEGPLLLSEGRLVIEVEPDVFIDIGERINPTFGRKEEIIAGIADSIRKGEYEVDYVSYEGEELPENVRIKGRKFFSYRRLTKESDMQEFIVFTRPDASEE